MAVVYRNEKLKGVIDLNEIVNLLDVEREVIISYRGRDIIISRDDNENICCDLYDTELQEATGGYFDDLGTI